MRFVTIQPLFVPGAISLALVLPFMILEQFTRGTFPLVLFLVMWLLPMAAIVIAQPVARRLWTREQVSASYLTAVLRIAISLVIVWLWVGLVVDQMPCFLGVPNCD